jgi:hypothetical protein
MVYFFTTIREFQRLGTLGSKAKSPVREHTMADGITAGAHGNGNNYMVKQEEREREEREGGNS